eukprot:1185313-Prorocentrum_minimum.AAC.4
MTILTTCTMRDHDAMPILTTCTMRGHDAMTILTTCTMRDHDAMTILTTHATVSQPSPSMCYRNATTLTTRARHGHMASEKNWWEN